MLHVLLFILGLLIGAACVFAVTYEMRKRLREQKTQQYVQGRQLEDGLAKVRAAQHELDARTAHLDKSEREFRSRVVSYDELQNENTILKRDLQNVDVSLRKLEMDRELHRQRQDEIDARTQELGGRYLKENVKWIGSSLTPSNYAACKQRLQDVIERCRSIGFEVPAQQEAELLDNLKAEFERIVRAAFDREEQARIKAQIREEQRLEREIERELKRLDAERAAIQEALKKALAEAKDEHSAEVERLRARLAEAEEKSRRTKSQAELTKSGHVYVISNIGSFGEGVFKIGLTRRLEPQIRVRELGDASVPFPFDVHMMISSDNAPALENALHRALHRARLNKTNPRKEFFRSEIEAIRQIVLEHHGEVNYVADPEALEYRQSLAMSDEDTEYIESVYDAAEEEHEDVADTE